ncbi:tRNA lysidine(34) synthetase TilS [Nesterenkonia sp. HG001]|uniref:tRNA lysidine(34) synthetase TilS n=1 Tax=Nesterenkonia sp. HG001 TaxID=2983207 RepID=UPI002AC3A75D|nr:tRNA lysidine(34) synthetase TilS [Nesterenkonia sp. HG001]MDZ5078219.1 tRNA lysidine(34) synthetase TilS [Nesterenkonia sp. HG001]
MAALPPVVGAARRAVAEMLDPDRPNLVACSGGADSLALAVAASHLHRRGEAVVGAVVVDHRLHARSAEVTAVAREQLDVLGLDPLRSLTVEVDQDSPEGPEAAARRARYGAFHRAMAETGASRVLLAHTRDDQAEQVLLGLARGSGTRSLAGMPAVRGPFRRPLLGLSRRDTEAICLWAGLTPWQDPANQDPRLLRSRVRSEVLPHLEEHLSSSVREALARTAQIAAEDADLLDAQAKEIFAVLLEDPDDAGRLRLPLDRLKSEPAALRRRIIALAVVAVGGSAPSFERLRAVESLLARQGSAGPIQLEGHVTAHRGTHDSPDYGKLVLVPRGAAAPGP